MSAPGRPKRASSTSRLACRSDSPGWGRSSRTVPSPGSSLGEAVAPRQGGTPLPAPVRRVSPWALGLALAVLAAWAGAAAAQGGHPFGQPEAAGWQPGGWLGRVFGQIALWQSHFYRQLTGAVHAWRQDGHAAWMLIGLSFAYGIFHALGPGHGKAVISAYVLANRQTARNGAVLALLSALVQALAAIALVTVAAGVLNLTGAAMNRATLWLEIGSYALVTALGLWLVWTRIGQPLCAGLGRRRAGAGPGGAAPLPMGFAALSASGGNGGGPGKGDGAGAGGSYLGRARLACPAPSGGLWACGCRQAHFAPPALVAGRLGAGRAWTAVLAVGLRPCSGALIVLVFALSQGLYAAGVVSALAMGLGTGLTVAVLAALALAASRAALGLGAKAAWGARLYRIVEGLAALAVLALGLALLGGALAMAGLAGGN